MSLKGELKPGRDWSAVLDRNFFFSLAVAYMVSTVFENHLKCLIKKIYGRSEPRFYFLFDLIILNQKSTLKFEFLEMRLFW